ncbi:MAG: prepilin peptidase [Actinomycetota bacterium]|nr:prepilin peptidase [Actinomycetota bacterium]
MPLAVLLPTVGLLGLLLGSFLNVVVWRVPRGESVVHPPSHCPNCGGSIGARDNVPVLSWLLLRGRCRHCEARISARYPLVELATAALFAVVAYRFGWSWELPAFLYLAAISVALALIDLDVKRLPNAIVLPSYPVVALLLLLPAAVSGAWGDYLRALIGMVALFALYFVLALVYPAGMGFGDVKLAGVLGLCLGWLGWAELAVGGFAGFLLGGVIGAVLMVVGRATRKSQIPFGPFMLVGAFIAVFWGDDLAALYLDRVLV